MFKKTVFCAVCLYAAVVTALLVSEMRKSSHAPDRGSGTSSAAAPETTSPKRIQNKPALRTRVPREKPRERRFAEPDPESIPSDSGAVTGEIAGGPTTNPGSRGDATTGEAAGGPTTGPGSNEETIRGVDPANPAGDIEKRLLELKNPNLSPEQKRMLEKAFADFIQSSPEAARALLAALAKETDPEMLLRMADFLDRSEDKGVWAELLRMAREDTSLERRRAAIRGLSTLATGDKAIVEAMLDTAQSDADVGCRANAARFLDAGEVYYWYRDADKFELVNKVRGALKDLILGSSDAGVREQAISSLAAPCGTDEDVQLILDIARTDRDEEIRDWAVYSLQYFGRHDREMVNALLGVATNEYESTGVRSTAVKTLEDLGVIDPYTRSVIDQLKAKFSEETEDANE